MYKFDRIQLVELADEKLHICKESIGKTLNLVQRENYIFCGYCGILVGINKEVEE